MKRSKALPRRRRARSTPGKVYAPSRPSASPSRPATTKYDATVEVAMRLGVDPRKADQMVRGTVNLPHGTGKTARVLVFANGDKAEAAREAGADYVGSDDMLEKVQGGWLDFDAVVATPDMMGKVGRLGKVLGPRGLMPNPKTGTVTDGRRQGRRPTSRAARSSSASTSTPTSTSSSARRRSTRPRSSRTTPPRWRRSCGSSRRAPRVATSRRPPSATTMGPGIPLDFSKTRNLLAEDNAVRDRLTHRFGRTPVAPPHVARHPRG